MSDRINFLLLGLGNGAVFAALAMALVVTYRSSGVLNFATGALALHGAYTYAFLRQGQLLNPIPPFDASIDIGRPLGFFPAMVIAVVIKRSSVSCCTSPCSASCGMPFRWRKPSHRWV